MKVKRPQENADIHANVPRKAAHQHLFQVVFVTVADANIVSKARVEVKFGFKKRNEDVTQTWPRWVPGIQVAWLPETLVEKGQLND